MSVVRAVKKKNSNRIRVEMKKNNRTYTICNGFVTTREQLLYRITQRYYLIYINREFGPQETMQSDNLLVNYVLN